MQMQYIASANFVDFVEIQQNLFTIITLYDILLVPSHWTYGAMFISSSIIVRKELIMKRIADNKFVAFVLLLVFVFNGALISPIVGNALIASKENAVVSASKEFLGKCANEMYLYTTENYILLKMQIIQTLQAFQLFRISLPNSRIGWRATNLSDLRIRY